MSGLHSSLMKTGKNVVLLPWPGCISAALCCTTSFCVIAERTGILTMLNASAKCGFQASGQTPLMCLEKDFLM